jgi:hypothetical protein
MSDGREEEEDEEGWHPIPLPFSDRRLLWRMATHRRSLKILFDHLSSAVSMVWGLLSAAFRRQRAGLGWSEKTLQETYRLFSLSLSLWVHSTFVSSAGEGVCPDSITIEFFSGAQQMKILSLWRPPPADYSLHYGLYPPPNK